MDTGSVIGWPNALVKDQKIDNEASFLPCPAALSPTTSAEVLFFRPRRSKHDELIEERVNAAIRSAEEILG